MVGLADIGGTNQSGGRDTFDRFEHVVWSDATGFCFKAKQN